MPGNLTPGREPTGRQISAQAYWRIYDRLPLCRRTALDILHQYGRQTANQVSSHLPKSGLDNTSTRTRLFELVNQGFIKQDGISLDPVSHQHVKAYVALEPGECAPRELVRRISRAALEAQLQAAQNELQAIWNALEQVVEEHPGVEVALSAPHHHQLHIVLRGGLP